MLKRRAIACACVREREREKETDIGIQDSRILTAVREVRNGYLRGIYIVIFR